MPEFFDVEMFNVNVEHKQSSTYGLYAASLAVVKIRIGEETLISAAEGNGPVNALDLALRKDLGVYQKHIQDVELLDFRVRVFQGGTDAVTRVLVEFGVAGRGALVDGRGQRQHHRGVVPGAGGCDHLPADQGRGGGGGVGRDSPRRGDFRGLDAKMCPLAGGFGRSALVSLGVRARPARTLAGKTLRGTGLLASKFSKPLIFKYIFCFCGEGPR